MTPLAATEAERLEFEAAMNAKRLLPRELNFARTKSPSGRDEYSNSHLESCWVGWQAARALQQTAEPVAWALLSECDPQITTDPEIADYWKRKGRSNFTPLYAAPDRAPSTDSAADALRLEFMMEREAWIAWSKDGESCRLFHRNDDGEPMPMLGWGARHWSHDPREAIDAAIAASLPQMKEE